MAAQRTMITLSRFAMAELEALAKAKREPVAKLVARLVEERVESPGFGQLLRRAQERAATFAVEDEDEDDDIDDED